MTNIVMLCRDRYTLTKQALESLHANTKCNDYTLTLVDDGSTDFKTVKMLHEMARDHMECSLIGADNSGHVLSQLKNLGVYWSEQRFGRGDWLYISDCDVYFKPNWLEKLTQAAESTEMFGFRLWGGQIHPFHCPSVMDSISSYMSTQGDVHFNLTEHKVLDGPSWLMRWVTWDMCGPFSRENAPGPCQSEEYPFCHRVKIGGGDSITDNRGGIRLSPARIGVIQPHVVIHTGLTQTDGATAPGAEVRMQNRELGVIYA